MGSFTYNVTLSQELAVLLNSPMACNVTVKHNKKLQLALQQMEQVVAIKHSNYCLHYVAKITYTITKLLFTHYN